MAVDTLKINCKPCMQDKHDECSNDNCLCKSVNHGIKISTLKDCVMIDHDKPISDD